MQCNPCNPEFDLVSRIPQSGAYLKPENSQPRLSLNPRPKTEDHATCKDALKIGKFVLQCDGMVDKSDLMQTIDALKADRPDVEIRHQELVFFDLAQTVSTWPKAWADLLMTKPADLRNFIFGRVPVLKGLVFESTKTMGSKLRSYLPSLCFAHDEENAEAAQDGVKLEEKDAENAEEPAASKSEMPSSLVSIQSIHRCCESSEGSASLLDDSMDAFLLGADELDVSFLCMVQHKLQFMVWSMYSQHLRENALARSVLIDLAKKGGESVIISKDAVLSEKFEMMMAGTVSMYPHGTPGKDHYPLCCLFGIHFYVNAPKDMSALDCVVPAWCTKVVARNDMAYFSVQHADVPVVMYMSGGEGGLQMQFASSMGDTFRKVLGTETCFADRTQKEQRKAMEKFETSGDAEGNAERTPWHQKRSDGQLRGLEFMLRMLSMTWPSDRCRSVGTS